jgi:hypothetical protein
MDRNAGLARIDAVAPAAMSSPAVDKEDFPTLNLVSSSTQACSCACASSRLSFMKARLELAAACASSSTLFISANSTRALSYSLPISSTPNSFVLLSIII